MQIYDNLEQWNTCRNKLLTHQTIGFVPTMGNLHLGHASLFKASSQENHYAASSLFINPTQFNRSADFEQYPRTIEADFDLMEKSGVDFCILPKPEDIYADKYHYKIREDHLCQIMEGKHRPGHFDGVLTIVMKLLNLVRPTHAYFGEKDYQQLLLIKGMVKAFFMNVEIKACPTIREHSGLAFSSRNNRLNKEQRIKADKFARIFHHNQSCEQIISKLQATNIQVEYVEEYRHRRFAAVMIDDIRLIDNYAIRPSIDN